MSGENSVFVKDKHIVFSGRIDSESIGKIMLAIKAMEEEDDVNESRLKSYTREPISFTISTNGGSVYDALALVDMIESCRTPIYTYAYGSIMSAGLPLFVAGHKRFCGKYTTFMYHEASTRIDDYGSIINSRTNEINRLETIVDKILIEKTKLNEKILKKWYSEREVYIDANSALKHGIVDKIL